MKVPLQVHMRGSSPVGAAEEGNVGYVRWQRAATTRPAALESEMTAQDQHREMARLVTTSDMLLGAAGRTEANVSPGNHDSSKAATTVSSGEAEHSRDTWVLRGVQPGDQSRVQPNGQLLVQQPQRDAQQPQRDAQ